MAIGANADGSAGAAMAKVAKADGSAGVERTRTTAQAQADGLRVFVAGVAWHLKEETLWRDFEECGAIEDLFLMKDQQGNSRGRAFITFRDKAAVEAALLFDSTEYGGRTIYVKVGEPKREKQKPEERPVKEEKPKPAGEKSFPVAKPEGCMAICMKNIGDATESDVRSFLDGCKIQSVRIVIDRTTGESRGIAFVDFSPGFDVDKAMEFNGEAIGENGLKVQMSYEAPRDRPRPDGCMTVAIKKLPATTLEVDVRKLLRGLKSLEEVRIICNKDRVCNGLAFAEFTEAADVESAIKRDGMKVKGEIVFICYETKVSKRQQTRQAAIEAAKTREAAGLAPKATPNWCPEGDGARRKKKLLKPFADEEEAAPPEGAESGKSERKRKKGSTKEAQDDECAGEKTEKKREKRRKGIPKEEEHEEEKGIEEMESDGQQAEGKETKASKREKKGKKKTKKADNEEAVDEEGEGEEDLVDSGSAKKSVKKMKKKVRKAKE